MTECERIIRKGQLSPDFLKPETRNEFYVDENRKKLWALSLDLLLEFDRVCRKYNLTYWLIGGSLLGAIRHKGFIPWDDDIDLCMPRNDYEKFILLSKEFCLPYFLQTPYTDPYFYYSVSRLRNSNTTYIVNTFKYQGFNQGIYVSVFPLDYWEEEGGIERFNRIKSLLQDNSAYMRKSKPDKTEEDLDRIKRHSGRNPLEVYEEVHAIASQYNDNPTNELALAVCTVYPYGKLIFNAVDFEKTIMGDFEGYSFPIPAGYDGVLKRHYGNYMQFPPVEKRGTWHNGVFIDPDNPYTKYIDQ